MYRVGANSSQVLKTHICLMYILDAKSREENKVLGLGSSFPPGMLPWNYDCSGALELPPPPHTQGYPFMTFPPNLDEKSAEQNRKVPEVESCCDSGTHSVHLGGSLHSPVSAFIGPLTFPPKLNETSAEENRKVPEVKDAGMPSFGPLAYGLSHAPPPPPPIPPSTCIRPFASFPLFEIPSRSPVDEATNIIYQRIAPIIAEPSFGKDVTKIPDPTKIEVILYN